MGPEPHQTVDASLGALHRRNQRLALDLVADHGIDCVLGADEPASGDDSLLLLRHTVALPLRGRAIGPEQHQAAQIDAVAIGQLRDDLRGSAVGSQHIGHVEVGALIPEPPLGPRPVDRVRIPGGHGRQHRGAVARAHILQCGAPSLPPLSRCLHLGQPLSLRESLRLRADHDSRLGEQRVIPARVPRRPRVGR